MKGSKINVKKPSRKILRRLNKIEQLALPQQPVLLKTTDTFIDTAERI